jgi:ADP-ribosylation factor protein 6
MEEAKSELSRIIQDREMRNVVLLVFANKQDVDGGKSWNISLRKSKSN